MADKKVIAVLGATGAQGGGLVRAILNDKKGEFKVRALTRNPNSDKAKALGNMGAELVTVDVDNYDSLKNAFQGAYGLYAVTFFWEHFSPEKETAQVASIAKATKEANIQHVVWSTLEDTRKWVPLDDNRMPTLLGKYKVPHLDSKGEADKFFTEHGVPTTNLLTSFYWENFIYFGMAPKKGEDGKLALSLPMGDKKLAGIAVDDIGKSAYEIFKNGNQYKGKTVGISGEQLTGKQMADIFTKSLGQAVTYNAVPFDVYRGLGFPGADDLGNMFQFFHDFENDFCEARNVEKSRTINPPMQDFKSWLEANKSKIPLE
jgi:uncharacterized protein YbjT (DUF2867 family)